VEEELCMEDIKKKVVELKKLGTTDLMLTGGEPTMRKDLLEILEFCKSLNFEEITVQTNGTNLDNLELLQSIKSIGNVKFNISFQSHDPRTSAEISQTPQSYARLMQALRYIGELKLPAYLTIVISKLNYPTLKEQIAFVHEKFPYIQHFSFNFIDPIYRAQENLWTIPTFAEAERYIHEAVDYMRQHHLTFRIEKLPLCYMSGFEEFSSDIRRGVFDEWRIMSFLRTKGDREKASLMIEQDPRFHYAEQCKSCNLQILCAGINFNYVKVKGDEEVYPIFDDPRDIIERVKGSKVKLPDKKGSKQISDDLELFRHAIDVKTNKNNVYDTYSVFLMDDTGFKDEPFIYEAWKEHTQKIRNRQAPDLLSMYIHVPFCKSNCDYCVYPSTTLNNSEDLEKYLAFIIGQMQRFSPLFKGLKLKTLYIGGGTPSIFSESQLANLLESIFELYEFEPHSERSIEFNPESTTFGKLKILEKHGFNKFSIGVQSLSQRVLDINRRSYQTKEMVRLAIEGFKKLDLNYINVDMVLGLKGDTEEDIVYTMEELFKMQPNNICIYPIKTTEDYLKQNYGSVPNFEQWYYPLFNGVARQLLPLAERYGFRPHYELGKLSYIAPLVFSGPNIPKRKIDWTYTHFNLPPFSNLCFGFYSHSRIVNYMDYMFVDRNNINTMFLKKFSIDPKDYAYRTISLSPLFEKVKFIVKKFYIDRTIPRAQYKELYGTDLVEDFSYAIEALTMLGVVSVTPDSISFKSLDETEWYAYLLFFVGRDNVTQRLRQWKKLTNI
jgi:coproporphyrinogen III oxidase-like Fe-S oxidoreductase/organic radical activating enzyme